MEQKHGKFEEEIRNPAKPWPLSQLVPILAQFGCNLGSMWAKLDERIRSFEHRFEPGICHVFLK